MTDKSLSEQLCEVCGIEGKWFEYTTETTDGCVNLGKKRVFPDFTQPENFVKLFELSLPKICGVKFTISQLLCESIEFKFSDKKTFLVQLLNFINVCKNFGRYIKQAIRKADWEY